MIIKLVSNTVYKIVTPFIFLSIIIFFTGCLSIKPGGVKSGKNLFETFYVGEDGTQYFIKPLGFSNVDQEEELFVDFTFRYKNEVRDSVIGNFTLQSSEILKNIDSISFSNAKTKILSNKVRLLFNERKKDDFNSRFTTKVLLSEFITLFDNNEWAIIVYKNNSSSTFLPTRKTKQAIEKLQEKVFVLLQ
jgi:hypothetical protein